MLELPDVTLCCIDTVNHALALRALRQSSAQVRFGRALFISDREISAPDVEVEIEPDDWAEGRDPQREKQEARAAITVAASNYWYFSYDSSLAVGGSRSI